MEEYITMPMGRQKTIALIAHDNKKQELLGWVRRNADILGRHKLCGTGTTARLIAEETDFPVRGYNSGPLGGDQQIGAKIADGEIDMIIFFWDPLEAQPHDPDVKALMRIAVVYDIPFADNLATADFLITSPLMDSCYDRRIINYNRTLNERLDKYRPEKA